jgi:ankyrin repeat protein
VAHDDVDCLKLLLKHANELDINEVDDEQMTPLHLAVYHNHVSHAKLLVRRKANTQLTDVEGKTALHWAAGHKGNMIAAFCQGVIVMTTNMLD